MEIEKKVEYYQNDDSIIKITNIEEKFNDNGFIENNFIILTKPTLDIFLKEDNPADLIALYTFYYYTAKWQKTNQAYCTDGYTQKGLKWGYDKFLKAKKKLLDFGLIEQIVNRKDNGKIEGFYIKLNYIFKKDTLNENLSTQKQVPCFPSNSKQSTNALSINNINALSDNNISKDIYNKKNLVKKLSLNESTIKDILDSYYKEISKLHPRINLNIFYNEEKIYECNKLIDYFINGFPRNQYNKLNMFIEKNNIKFDIYTGFKTKDKFLDFFNTAIKCLDINYFPDKKDKIPNNLLNFLWNDFSSFSYFLYYGFNCTLLKDIQKEKEDNRKRKEKYPNIVNKFITDLNLVKSDDLIQFVNQLVEEHNKIINQYIIYNDKKYTREQIDDYDKYKYHISDLNGFIQEYIYWLENKLDNDNFSLNFSYFKSYLKEFNNFIFSKYETNLYLLKETMIDKIEKYLSKKSVK